MANPGARIAGVVCCLLAGGCVGVMGFWGGMEFMRSHAAEPQGQAGDQPPPPPPPPAKGSGSAAAQAAALKAAEDLSKMQTHVLKVQETVLHQVEESNKETKEEIDFGLMVIGGVISVVLAIFAFFGFSTAAEAREVQRALEERLERARQLASELERLKATRQDIVADAAKQVTPSLEKITDYCMKIAEFAGGWYNMSFMERIRDAAEVERLLRDPVLAPFSETGLSFILARRGVALLDNGKAPEAVVPLAEACDKNPRQKPDRHYNLACCYARLSTYPDATPGRKEDALGELAKCLAMATDEPPSFDPKGKPQFSSLSKAWFKFQAAKDPDFAPLKDDPAYRPRLEQMLQPYPLADQGATG